jgi:WD40 repeat protein/tetratricopeptide (TPR) repeat protein
MPENSPSLPPTEARFEQLLASLLQAEERGEQLDFSELLRTAPELETPLREFFRNRDGFDRLAPQLAPPARRSPAVPTRPDLPPGSRFAGYEILQELGHGGMGVVYQARQLVPEREVALKVIRIDRLEDLSAEEQRQWLERFRREAQVVASLEQHPNLVTLYEVGEHDGRPFFTMQLVRGGRLTENVQAARERVSGKGSIVRAARMVATVARAVDHVHRRGVLHRDLKPANILLDESGQPLVSDFGLARRLDQSGSLVAGAIEGTAEYMAPEQARGLPGAVTTAADVYSLGAILYALLTGRPPFKGSNDLETLLLVMGQEPTPPRALNPRVPKELQIICLKCLEKEPGRRYSSATALAEDLDNWLAGRPISARPVGAAGRLWRWSRRNPVPALAASVILVIALAAFVLIADSRNRALVLAGEKSQLADDKGRLADENGDLARRNGDLAQEKAHEANRARDREKEAQREAIHLAFQQATEDGNLGEVGRAMHLLAHGLALAEQTAAPDLEQLLRANLAAWHLHLHTLHSLLPHPAGVSAVAWSPDGRTLATACWDHTTRLWDVASGKPRGEPVKHNEWITGLVFSPDGKTLLTVGYSRVGVWQVASGQRLVELDHHMPTSVSAAAFAPDGQTILTGASDGKARLWDTSGKQLGEPLSHGGWIEAVAYAPDAPIFAAGGNDGIIFVWDAASRRVMARLEQPGVTSLAFGLEGRLLTGGEDRKARLWRVGSPRSRVIELEHQGPVKAVALSPDSSLALTGSLDGTARVWDTATGQRIGQPLIHSGEVLSVAFGLDGRTVATGCGRERGEARVWDVALGRPLGGPLTHARSILAVAVSPDGQRVATAGRDNVARLWDARTCEPIGDALPHNSEVNAVVFSPDSQTLVSGGDDSIALFWHAATGKPVVFENPRFGLKNQQGVGFTGRMRAWHQPKVGRPGGPFWGPARGKQEGRRGDEEASVFALAYAPSGKSLVTVGRSGGAVLWDPQRGAAVPSMRLEVRDKDPRGFGEPRSSADLFVAAFSPDGRLIALGGEGGEVHVWDATKFDLDALYARAKSTPQEELIRLWDEALTPHLAAGPLKHDGEVVALAFTPDSSGLLTGCSDGIARLWDMADGKLRRELKHKGPVVAVAFSPDGQAFVTGSWDGAARVWRTATGEPAGPPLFHRSKVLSVAFSRDGRAVLTGSEDWSARLWDAATGQPIGPSYQHQDAVQAVAFRPDGRAAITAAADGVGRIWPIPSATEGSAQRITEWVEAQTGLARSPDGSLHPLDVAAWEGIVARLGGWQPVGPEDRLGWHRREARAAEASGRWQAAHWHLDRLIAADPKAGHLYLRRGKASLALRDPAPARRDFDQATVLLPADWDARFQCGRLAFFENRWADAIGHMDKALELRKAEVQVNLRGPPRLGTAAILLGRGHARAALGEWKEAAKDLAVVRSPFDESYPSDWLVYALVLLKQGDNAAYGAVCKGMLDRFANPRDEASSTVVTSEYGRREVYRYGRPFDPVGAATMVWTCCLSPNGAPDVATVLRLARRAAESDRQEYLLARAYGAALYRAREYEAAVKQLEAAAALRKQPSPSVWLLLAMAQERCQHKDQAKELLTRARDWMARARAAKPGTEDPEELTWDRLRWTERLALEFLEHEAAQQIEVSPGK